MGVLSTILYIIIFLLCLSILIIIHELGHLSAAKAFNVYCLEFSCGMGPLLWKHKRKGGETQLSLRAIPFGGYVSMYGEGVELPDGVTVEPSRSLTGVKPWKKGIILVAGVAMNALLALVIFFVNNVAFEQTKFMYSNEISVVEGSKADLAGLKNEDILAFDDSYESSSSLLLGSSIYDDDHCILSTKTNPATITYSNSSTKDVAVVLTPNMSFVKPVYSISLFELSDGKIVSSSPIEVSKDMTSISITYSTRIEKNTYKDYTIKLDIVDGVIEDSGLRIYTVTYRYGFFEALGQTFVDFGSSSTAIVQTFAGMFTGDVAVDQLSGVVGIGFEAKNILDSFGVSTFIYLWGLISVNLAIFNLLPFPGLDGWQLLVLIIESIAHKKIPEKVSNIVSYVGLAILLTLMVVILFKDLWVYIFKGLLGGIFLC